jgi:hypothetical protein
VVWPWRFYCSARCRTIALPFLALPCARKPRVKGMAYQTGPTPSVPRGEKRKAKPDDRASPPDDQPCSLPRLRRARAEGRTRMGDRGCLLIGVPLNGCWDRASDSVGARSARCCAGCRASSLLAARAANGGAESPC